MIRPVDLVAVMEARAELRRIAIEHPEAFDPERLRLLADNLEHYMTPAKTRMQISRDRAKAEGRKRIAVTITREAAAALEALKTAGYGRDYNEIVSAALLRLAIDAITPAGSAKGHAALVDSHKARS